MAEFEAVTPPPFLAAERKALRDSIYDALHEMLIAGGFAAGEALSIEQLAQRFKVSPTPVREALVQLESTGLVTRTALRGYHVAAPFSREEMGHLFDARMLLETGAISRAAVMTDQLAHRLRELHGRHVRLASSVSQAAHSDAGIPVDLLREYFRADWAFHDAIIHATQNRFIIDMSTRISTHAQRLRHFMDRNDPDVDQAVAEHERILIALEGGQPRAAVEAMQRHIEAVRSRDLDGRDK